MTLPRQKFRELVFQLLFSQDFSLDKEGLDQVMMHLLKTTKAQVKKAAAEVEKILEKKVFLDKLIRKTSTEYRLERISKAEVNIIRVALFEIFFIDEIPVKVSIKEAIRLSRKFGSETGSEFVNAILDAIYQEHKLELKKEKPQKEE